MSTKPDSFQTKKKPVWKDQGVWLSTHNKHTAEILVEKVKLGYKSIKGQMHMISSGNFVLLVLLDYQLLWAVHCLAILLKCLLTVHMSAHVPAPVQGLGENNQELWPQKHLKHSEVWQHRNEHDQLVQLIWCCFCYCMQHSVCSHQ